KAGVTARAAFRIEVAHRGAHVGLQQTDAEYVEDESEEEEARAACSEQRVAGRNQHAARGDCELPSNQLVGHPAAEEREQVRPAQVQPPDGARTLIREPESTAAGGSRQEQDQDRLDAVEGEPLPHLREEERR